MRSSQLKEVEQFLFERFTMAKIIAVTVNLHAFEPVRSQI